MNRILVLTIFSVLVLACGLPAVAPIAPDPELSVPVGVVAVEITPTAELPVLYTVISGVYLRQSPNGDIVGSLDEGERVHAICNSDGWCQVSFGVQKLKWFWIGCTDRPQGFGCEGR